MLMSYCLMYFFMKPSMLIYCVNKCLNDRSGSAL